MLRRYTTQRKRFQWIGWFCFIAGWASSLKSHLNLIPLRSTRKGSQETPVSFFWGKVTCLFLEQKHVFKINCFQPISVLQNQENQAMDPICHSWCSTPSQLVPPGRHFFNLAVPSLGRGDNCSRTAPRPRSVCWLLSSAGLTLWETHGLKSSY